MFSLQKASRKKKAAIILGISAMVFTIGFSSLVGYARHHRYAGRDYPFDSAAYYDPTRPDYADSPSTYALRDLAAHGGDVHDLTRDLKSTIFKGHFSDIASLFTTQNILAALDHTGIGENIIDYINGFSDRISVATDGVQMSIGKIHSLSEIYGSSAGPDEDVQPMDPKEKMKLVNDNLLHATEAAAEVNASTADQQAMLQTAVAINANAQGKQQIQQAGNIISGVQSMANVQKTNLLSALLQAKGADIKNDLINEETDMDKAEYTNIYIQDPYDKQTAEANKRMHNYERKKIAMPDF